MDVASNSYSTCPGGIYNSGSRRRPLDKRSSPALLWDRGRGEPEPVSLRFPRQPFFHPGDRHAQRDDAYIRFDIGMTQAFRVGSMDLEVREEIANLFDEFNAVGFRQLPAPDGSMALLPRGLGPRVYNVEASVRF